MYLLVNYFGFDDLVKKHDEVIDKSGGIKGILSNDLLRGCLDFIRNDDYYPTFDDKITHLVFSIAKNHGFNDGNKRTAIIAGAYLLEINSFDQFIIDVFIQEMENVILMVVQNILLKEDFKRIIHDYIYDAKLSDETEMIYVRLLGEL
jgi:death-on-curing protein